LVAIEVGSESLTNQGMDLNGTAIDQNGFKGLNAQPMESRSAVEKNGPFLCHLLQRIPNLGHDSFHHPLGAFDIVGVALFHKAMHDKGFKQLQGHTPGQAALM
jgi:hypothetical protein